MLQALKQAFSAFYQARRRAKLFSCSSLNEKVASLTNGPSSTFFVSSEKGLFRIDKDSIYKAIAYPIYGFAIVKEKVYISTIINDESLVLEGERSCLYKKGKLSFQHLYSFLTPVITERIHQLTSCGDTLLASCTSKGAVVEYNINDREISIIYLLQDQFGAPIKNYQNHINSAVAYGDVILFVAYKAGGKALIGAYDKVSNSVVGYSYPNMGVHDVYFVGGEIIFCDTIGKHKEDEGGNVIKGGEFFWEEAFNKKPGYMPRGIARYNNDVIIGSSHKGKRSERFKGNGKLLIGTLEACDRAIDLPFAQVYQILNCEGGFFTSSNESITFQEANKALEKALGKPSYKGSGFIERRKLGEIIL